jgi:hypothetical protein
MADPASQATRVYPISPRRRALLVAIWALFTLPLVIAGLLLDDPAALASGGLAGLILGLIFAATAWRLPRLVLTPGGVTLHQFGYRLDSPWSNVAALYLGPGQAGLMLRQPMSGRGAARLTAAVGSMRRAGRSFAAYPPEVLDCIAARCYIPIEPFRHWLRHGDLERRLAEHAPWLAAAAAANPESTR